MDLGSRNRKAAFMQNHMHGFGTPLDVKVRRPDRCTNPRGDMCSDPDGNFRRRGRTEMVHMVLHESSVSVERQNFHRMRPSDEMARDRQSLVRTQTVLAVLWSEGMQSNEDFDRSGWGLRRGYLALKEH